MTNTNVQMVPVGTDRAKAAPGGTAPLELPASTQRSMEEHRAWPMIGRLPVLLSVPIPLRGFKVRELLNLRCGQTIASTWAVTEDIPLQTGALPICWGEFEVVGQRIAIRLTRLA
jgi:flagellar motor switch protein FliN/FliY